MWVRQAIMSRKSPIYHNSGFHWIEKCFSAAPRVLLNLKIYEEIFTFLRLQDKEEKATSNFSSFYARKSCLAFGRDTKNGFAEEELITHEGLNGLGESLLRTRFFMPWKLLYS